MHRFTICILSCVNYVFISVAHIITKVFTFQKLQCEKRKKRPSRRANLADFVKSKQRSLSDKDMQISCILSKPLNKIEVN